jgi:hypothetical protein
MATLPPSFLHIAEVDRGDRLVAPLFRRKFACEPPAYGHHMIAFHLRPDGSSKPAGYLNVWMRNGLGYVGGGCTDGQVIREMQDAERAALTDSGGVLLHLLGYCFRRFEPELDAFVGHCGNARAKEVDLRAGFRETKYDYLLVRPNADLPAARLEEIVEEAFAAGAF